MSNLVPRRAQPPAQLDPVANAEVAAAHRAGFGAVARIQTGAFVTSVALQNATMLSRAANAAFKVNPMGEEVYQAIFMAYGSLAVAEIQALSLQGRGQS
jgi:hypothetical protein